MAWNNVFLKNKFILNQKWSILITQSLDNERRISMAKHNTLKKIVVATVMIGTAMHVANEFIMKNKSLGYRTRLLQWMAWKGQWWFVRAYYMFVYRIIYGIVYK